MNNTHTAYLLTGTNIGNRRANLDFAIKQLNQLAGQVTLQSTIYETEPWGVQNQPAYFNQALAIQTSFSPKDLLIQLKEIESLAGRAPNSHMQPRVLDIDILLFDELIISSRVLRVPHPQLINRNFAIVPLAEIAPDYIHPVLQVPINKLRQLSKDTLHVEKLDTSILVK